MKGTRNFVLSKGDLSSTGLFLWWWCYFPWWLRTTRLYCCWRTLAVFQSQLKMMFSQSEIFFPTSTDRELFSISDLRCVVVTGTSERSVSCVNVIIVLKLAVLQTSAPKGLQSSCQGKGSLGRSRFMKSHSAGFTPWKTLVGKVWVLAPTGILIVPPADLCDFGNLLSSLGQFPYLWCG